MVLTVAYTYIINAPILTHYGEWRFQGPLSVTQARSLRRDGFISAIGHQASAGYLSGLLAIDIPVNRIQVSMEANDRALILRLRQRLPEGKLLNEEEMLKTTFELALLTRTA